MAMRVLKNCAAGVIATTMVMLVASAQGPPGVGAPSMDARMVALVGAPGTAKSFVTTLEGRDSAPVAEMPVTRNIR